MNEALTPGTAFRGRVLVAMDIHAGKDLKVKIFFFEISYIFL